MKAPRPSFTPSRLNVGAYAVTVRTIEPGVSLVAPGVLLSKDRFCRVAFNPACTEVPWAALQCFWNGDLKGTANADGSLTLEPERWAVRHYRRAIMRGAGVYQAGLWAFLAGQRVKRQGGAALWWNDAGTLARYGSPLKPPPQHITQVIDMTPRAGELTPRQVKKKHGAAAASAYFTELVRSTTAAAMQALTEAQEAQRQLAREIAQAQAAHLQNLKAATEAITQASEQQRRELSNFQGAVKAEIDKVTRESLAEGLRLLGGIIPTSELTSALFSSVQSAFAEQRAAATDGIERWIIEVAQRQVLRRLRRLLPRLQRPRQPASVPRPLHARPRPPAAPLAPPRCKRCPLLADL